MAQVRCGRCGWVGLAGICGISLSPYHDMTCARCGSTNLDTSEVNKEWAAKGRVYGFGDRNKAMTVARLQNRKGAGDIGNADVGSGVDEHRDRRGGAPASAPQVGVEGEGEAYQEAGGPGPEGHVAEPPQVVGTLELVARLDEALRQADLWRKEHRMLCDQLAEVAGLPKDPYPGTKACICVIREKLAKV